MTNLALQSAEEHIIQQGRHLPAQPSLPGITVSKFLGEAGQGQLWLGRWNISGEQVVIKQARTSSQAQQMRTAAQLAQRWNHPHLNRCHAVMRAASGEEVSVWEYLPAGSLADLIHVRRTLPVAEAVTILVPVIQAVQFLHRQGVVHGDLSADNIMFDISGRPVITDFGSLRAAGVPVETSGTPGFSAPELFTVETTGIQPAADVYSLGALGWYILTGRLPPDSLRRAALTDLVAGVDTEVSTTIEEALNDRPEARPSLEELVKAVYSWSEPTAVNLYPSVGHRLGMVLPTMDSPETPTTSRKKLSALLSRISRRTTRKGRAVSRGAGSNQAGRPRPQRDGSTVKKWSSITVDIRTRVLRRTAIAVLSGGMGLTLIFTALKGEEPEGANTEADSLAAENLGSEIDHNAAADSELKQSGKPIEQDPQEFIDQLAKTRTQALADRNLELVGQYSVVGSQVYEEDSELIEELLAQDSQYRGLHMRGVLLEGNRGDFEQQDSVSLPVQWRTEGYVLEDADGKVLQTYDPATQELELTLSQDQGRWVVEAITDTAES